MWTLNSYVLEAKLPKGNLNIYLKQHINFSHFTRLIIF